MSATDEEALRDLEGDEMYVFRDPSTGKLLYATNSKIQAYTRQRMGNYDLSITDDY